MKYIQPRLYIASSYESLLELKSRGNYFFDYDDDTTSARLSDILENRVTFIVAEPGQGKTRLIEELEGLYENARRIDFKTKLPGQDIDSWLRLNSIHDDTDIILLDGLDESPNRDIIETIRGLVYHINGHSFEKQYKEILSGYRSWEQLAHAQKWLLFENNIGKSIAIDETSLSNGELYTIVTNRDRHGREGCLIAIIAGTKSLDVCKVLDEIDEKKREDVEEVTLDLSDSMRKIVRHCFPKAKRVIDRFHIQKLAIDAVQQMRIEHRWAALQEANEEKENAKLEKRAYQSVTFENGDTRSELLVRSRYLLFKSSEKWTDEQKLRAKILFREYPDIKKAYGLSHSLRMIFAKNTVKDAARLSLAKWYNKVEEANFHSFNVIAATIYEHYDDILNFYINRATNAAAESFNAKIKLFRANVRGVVDKSFFLFRIAKLYAYPH